MAGGGGGGGARFRREAMSMVFFYSFFLGKWQFVYLFVVLVIKCSLSSLLQIFWFFLERVVTAFIKSLYINGTPLAPYILFLRSDSEKELLTS